MTVSTRLSLSTGSRLRLATLGDAALYACAPGSEPKRVLEVGKPLALLIYLACSHGREASREHLMDLLWSHMELGDAQNALRQAIWLIRSRFGHDTLTATRERVSLVESMEIDRDALLAASAAGDVRRVVEFYKGDFVVGFAAPGGAEFEQWADIERLSLRRLFVRSVEEVVQQCLASGHAREALVLARRARDLDRLNQRAWRRVLECLIAAGDVVGTLIEADALAQLLDAEEIEPELATRAAIREARNLSSRSRNGAPEAAPSGLVAELVGREGEFATLMRGWDDASHNQATHFYIVAAAGYGKSRLVIDVHNRIRAAGGRAVYVRADFGARLMAYSFASDLAARLAKLRGASGISPSSAGTLVALNPSLSSVYSAERDVAVDDEALRRRALALRELISAVAEEHALALLIDDLHWTDIYSFRVLDAALGGIEKGPLLVVWAGRPAADGGRRPTHGTAIELELLGEDDVSALVSSIANLPVEPWAERLPHALCEATGGSPLLILETLQLLTEKSLLVRSVDGWVVNDADAVFEALAHGSALRHRVASLTETEGSILLLLAVSGMPLDREVLSEAAARSSGELAEAIAILEQRGLVLRHGNLVSVAHDEHARAAMNEASDDSRKSAAGAVGRALLAHAGHDTQKLGIAGSLLAQGDGSQFSALSTAFERFARARRLANDRRRDRVLARDLLGTSATDQNERALVRSLPWLVQARLVSHGRIVAAIAIAVISLLSAVGAWTVLSRPEPRPDALLAASRMSIDRKSLELFPVPLDASRWAGRSILDVPLSGRPRWRMKAGSSAGSELRPDGEGWTAGMAVRDSGAIDIFDFDTHGSERRLTFARSDDYGPSWAPDNRRFVFITAQWSTRGHYDLAIYDTLTKGVRHLTQGDDTDWEPSWSPDGSRIAFIRQYAQGGQRGLCVIDADGSNLRCLPPEPNTVINLVRWADAHRVFLRRLVGARHQFMRFHLETGAADFLDDPSADALISPDGRFAVCTCQRPGFPPGTWIVYPLERPNEFAELRVVGGDARRISFAWAPTTPRLPYIFRMSISVGLGPPMVGGSHQLRAFAFDSLGRAVEPGVVRWRSEDTTVAKVDSSGRLLPRRAGRVTIHASAGGWRGVSVPLTIAEPVVRVVLDENWTHGFDPTWRVHGDPKPRLIPDPTFGHAFLNNGDGSFFSGAYTARTFDTRAGLWVDTELAAPIVAAESQELVLHFFAIKDSAAWADWDHVTGDGPPGTSSPGWGVRYPQGIGGPHFGEQMLIAEPSGFHYLDVPPSFRTGRAFRLTMQIFPDGRCGVALDGKAAWVGSTGYLEPSVRLMLAGNSVGTKVLVGPLRIGTGIAPGISWTTEPARVQ